jgi:hypothetical protein
MSERLRFLTVLGALLALSAVLIPTSALAHQKRTVGKYTFLVGFLGEPTIQGQPNGLDLTITDSAGNPVDGAEKSLKVGIAYGGGAARDLPLTAQFGLKGKYTADVIPTRAGSYSFIFSGSINGDAVNERFDSGPNTFEDVVSPQSLEFPEAVPPPADLAQQAQTANATAQAALQRATLFGLGGVAVGLVGIVLAVVALLARVRPVVPVSESEEIP